MSDPGLDRVQEQLITDYKVRLGHQAEELGDHLRPGSSILDVGCGTGYLPKYLEEMYGVKSTGLDVADFNETDIAFAVFDGVRIPLPDQSFGHVMLSLTGHHAHDPMTLIQECRRVARRSVLVFEDMPDNRYGRFSSRSMSNCSG
jgi:ubiquinone/menaquinone biosynthesis C-methylase UbiE